MGLFHFTIAKSQCHCGSQKIDRRHCVSALAGSHNKDKQMSLGRDCWSPILWSGVRDQGESREQYGNCKYRVTT